MMPIQDVGDWLDEQTQDEVVWYVKRLSANDTQATGGHQAGPYIPKQVIFDAIPSLNQPAATNPRVEFELTIDSHPDARTVSAIWYNQLTRNEARLTNFGGASSPLLDPYSTGALTIFAFRRGTEDEPPACRVWVCETAVEEDRVEDRIGPVEPGHWRTWPDLFSALARPARCWLDPEDIPREWLARFPTGEELIQKTVQLRPEPTVDVDLRLIHRRNCEFELFRSLEQAVEWPRVLAGYANMDAFLKHAQSVLQRRRARSGNSLELHIQQILGEEELVKGQDFDYKPESEPNKEPDFLFPSARAYQNATFPDHRLRMLAVKTTLRDRWRQVLNEADRIKTKHILTLQEGVSENQFREIREAGVELVVPKSLHSKYPRAVRQDLQTLESFLADIRLLAP